MPNVTKQESTNSSTPNPNQPSDSTLSLVPVAQIQLVVLAGLLSLVIYLVAVNHTFTVELGYSSNLPISFAHGWVLAQSILLICPGLCIGLALSLFSPRLGVFGGTLLMVAVVTSYVLDLMVYSAIGERLLSATTYRIAISLLPGIWNATNKTMIISLVEAIAGAALLALTLLFISRIVARRLAHETSKNSVTTALLGLLLLIIALTIAPAFEARLTVDNLRNNTLRNPLMMTSLIKSHGVGVARPEGLGSVDGVIRAVQLAEAVERTEMAYNESQFSTIATATNPEKLPDVLVVLIESFRPDAISEQSTPNLYKLAKRGTWCKNHYSSANSTNMGIFSLMYGLDPYWFTRAGHSTPILVSHFRNAGYEVGFFGGTNDWELFGMDGFINPTHFDSFATEPVNWTQSDKHMTRLAMDFLSNQEAQPGPNTALENDGSASKTRKPRLAILYYYSTHFDYRSEPQDQVHVPFATDELTGTYGVTTRDQVWNRYLNSTHFVDRMLGKVLRDDLVIAIAGDHGESFLEDGCRLHGVRISRYQNASVLLFAGPGIPNQEITSLTGHVDLVPTLFDAVGISSPACTVLDGQSLLNFPSHSDRLLTTRNYVRPELVILGPWTKPSSPILGYRIFFSIDQWIASPGNAVDINGLEMNPSSHTEIDETEKTLLDWLHSSFGYSPPAKSTSRSEIVADLLRSNSESIIETGLNLVQYASDDEIEGLKTHVVVLTRHSSEKIRSLAQRRLILLEKRLGTEPNP